jgi:hypothetical protein
MKIPAFLFISMFFQIAYGQQSLNVFEGNFDDALALAKKQNKDIFSDQRLFTFVERHRKEFFQENGREEVSEYLLDNYTRYLSYKKEKKVERLSKKYPFTTIPEAKRALKLDKTRRTIL